MRFLTLLVALGGGFWLVASVFGAGDAPLRHGLAAPQVEAPADDDAPGEGLATRAAPQPVLPATVRRLAESPVTGPLHPVIIGTAEPLPVAEAIPAAVVRVGGETRRVSVNSANVRGGPSTGFGVVGRVARGEEVEVIERGTDGWLHIRIQGDGLDGWIAERLVGPPL